uniref:Uncharacterized protein n=1 Tax=Arundo donax TaxID=35708 RepID=A0A0A9EBQ8_ARUDO
MLMGVPYTILKSLFTVQHASYVYGEMLQLPERKDFCEGVHRPQQSYAPMPSADPFLKGVPTVFDEMPNKGWHATNQEWGNTTFLFNNTMNLYTACHYHSYGFCLSLGYQSVHVVRDLNCGSM